MERVPLEVEAREPGPSSAARALRRTGKIPGVLYGAGREASSFAVSADGAARGADRGAAAPRHARRQGARVRRPRCPRSSRSSSSTRSATACTHVDLLAIRLDEPIEARATVNLIGEPRGVKFDGGVLEQPTHEISVFGLPADLVDHVDVDVSRARRRRLAQADRLAVPAGLDVPGRSRLVLATVTGSSPVEAPEDEAAAAEAAEAADVRRRRRPRPRPSRPPAAVPDADRSWTASSPGSATRVGATARTRHNLGFKVAELLAARHGADPSGPSTAALLQRGPPAGRRDAGAASARRSFMNVSGGPVARAAKAYGLGPEQIVVRARRPRVAVRPGARQAGRGARRPQRPALAGRARSARAISCACGSASAGRGRGDTRDIADWVLSPFEPDEDPGPMIAAAADCGRADRARGHRRRPRRVRLTVRPRARRTAARRRASPRYRLSSR